MKTHENVGDNAKTENGWDGLKDVKFTGENNANRRPNYNEKFINDFGRDKLREILGNKETLKTISGDYIGQYEPDSQSRAINLAEKESLDHFVIERLSSDHPEMFIKSQEFKNYADYVVKIADEKQFKSNSGKIVLYPEYFTNPVLRNKKMRELVLKTAYRDKNPDMDKMNAWLYQRETEYKETIRGFVEKGIGDHEKLSQKQMDIIGDYIYAGKNFDDGIAKKFAEYCFNDIKEEYNLKPSTPMMGALTNYFASCYSIDEGVRKNSRIIIANPGMIKNKKGKEKKEFNIGRSKNFGCVLEQNHFAKLSLVSDNSLNKSRTNLDENNDIYRLMMISFHELTHDHQKNMAEKGDKSSSSMAYIMRNVLNKDGQKCYEKETEEGEIKEVSYYKANHDSDEIEIQADEEAWRQCRIFLVEHQKFQVWNDEARSKRFSERWQKCASNEKEVRARRSFVKKLAMSGEKEDTIKFDIDNMKLAISENPSLLDRYPQLKDYFESSGDIKVDILINEQIAKTDYTNNLSDRRDDVFGAEIGTYIMLQGEESKHLRDYLEKNGDKLDETQIKNLLNNMHNIIHQNIEKRRFLVKGINVENYDETKTWGKDFDIEEIKRRTQVRYLGQYRKMIGLAEVVRKTHPEMSERITLEETENARYFYTDLLKDGSILDKDFAEKTIKRYESLSHPFLMQIANTLREQYEIQ